MSEGQVSLLGGETEENKVDSTQQKACIDETWTDPSGTQKEATNEEGKAGREVSRGNDEGTSGILAGEEEASCKATAVTDKEIHDAVERAAADAVILTKTEEKVEADSVVSEDAALVEASQNHEE